MSKSLKFIGALLIFHNASPSRLIKGNTNLKDNEATRKTLNNETIRYTTVFKYSLYAFNIIISMPEMLEIKTVIRNIITRR